MLGERRKKCELKETKERFAWHHGRSQGGATMDLVPRSRPHSIFKQQCTRCQSRFWLLVGLGVIGSRDQTKKGRLQEACLTRRASLHKSTLTCCAFKYPTCKGFNCWGLEVTQMRVLPIELRGQTLAVPLCRPWPRSIHPL